MKNIILRTLAAGVAVLIIGGCSSPSPSFEYPPAFPPLIKAGPQVTASHSITVEKFQDFRGKSNDITPIYLYLVPLCPFGYFDYERPENGEWYMGIDQYHFDPSSDFSRAAAVSLKYSGLFTQVLTPTDSGAAQSDYILRGAILTTYYRSRTFSYGLSFEGAWMWVIGAPAGTSLNRVGFCLWLVDRKTGRTVWTYGFDRDDYLTIWLYFRYDKEMSMYPKLTAEGMNGAVMELEKFLYPLPPPAPKK